ncbi:glycoside hydrolase family 2 TIM barrel-domain containing protein [Saccharicrinis sp. GN24d3]|uniref:glycoside hydrolase family 2 TIM barrel-domain containing protein n=1 Tax=Saccharicrinis sp. GN24d3 TaxID=3458416 RepID=UPI0040358430
MMRTGIGKCYPNMQFKPMKAVSGLLLLFTFNLVVAQSLQEKINFNEDWYFLQQDNAAYSSESYDHSGWRKLDLPHDWSIEGEYDKFNPMGGTCGYLPAGIGFYRKTIDVPSEWKGNKVNIAFDGVFMNSTVWANGQKLGERPYGWISFTYDISDIVSSADQITFAVRADNELQPSARWYTGSGIYADTWIEVMNPVHVVREGGVFIKTDDNVLSIDTEVVNRTESSVSLSLKTRILNDLGMEVENVTSSLILSTAENKTLSQEITIANAHRWSVENPYLYTAVSEVWQGSELLDNVVTRFGVRDVQWIPESGMWLNGENVKLQGVCNHQDAGALGAAVPDKILRYRIQQLKDMGCNAIRTTHNPQTPKFYEMCDEIGMLVMDEIFDGWKKKAKNDYGAHHFADCWEADVTSWIKRDRNHPSIIIWSVGNETSNTSGGTEAQDLVAKCKGLDPTRLVTSGHSGSAYMDVLGYNGASERVDYLNDLAGNTKPIVGTENTHTWQVRGYYRTKTWYRDGNSSSVYATENLTDHEIFYNDFMYNEDRTVAKKVFNSGYDNAYVRLNSRGHIEQVRDITHYAGGFRWTGYDYIGEASYVHGGWPFKAFNGGAIDLANFEKDLYYLYQSQWTDEPMAHILPHWTHPKMELDTEIPVWVYSNCDEVELFLNDIPLGKQTPGETRFDMQCEWLVPWQPGDLKAVGYVNGSVAVEKTVASAFRPTQNSLSIDGVELNETGKDIVQVRVETKDSIGNFYPHGENRTYFKVFGPGRIRALDNGSPIDVEKHFGVDNRIAFYGLTRAYIESTGESGDINLLASAILGEKKQLTSNWVSIDTQILNLRGNTVSPDIKMYYTIDGSTPSTGSTLYTESFAVPLETTVKALVMVDGEIAYTLMERFSEDEGFVWNDPAAGEIPSDINSNQAEDAVFSGANISTSGSGYNGTGFLNFGQNTNGYVEWYRENDGDTMTETLNIRYGCQAGGTAGGRYINVVVNDVIIQENLLLPNTGSWGNHWGEVSIEIQIERGANTIRLQNPGSGGAYLDQISLENATAVEQNKTSEVCVLPVPVKDILTIKGVENPNWSVYNMAGKVLMSGSGNEMDVSIFAQGMYIIHIQDNLGNVTLRKFIK